jgi:hypothetical protein
MRQFPSGRAPELWARIGAIATVLAGRISALASSSVAPLESLVLSCRRASIRNRTLCAVWILFLVLVGLGAHGSSLPSFANLLEPGADHSGYVLTGIEQQLESALHSPPGTFTTLCQTQPRRIRSDEYLLWTPYALSQVNHQPPFPVVNRALPGGQNMLLIWNAPVAHVATVARPATWGYFFLDAGRGLAWQWWFPPFACFMVLWLLFEIVFRGQTGLAAFGAAWFGFSAHTVGWSLMPAYDTFFAALICLSAYQLLAADRLGTLWIYSLLLGLALAGFAMVLYPPWQIVLVYFFAALFVGLIWRDRPWRQSSIAWSRRLLAAGVGVALAVAIVGVWALDCRAALSAMASTVHPGERLCLGGALLLSRLFVGWFNLISLYGPSPLPGSWRNPSESASFYHLYPAALLGLVLLPSLRRSATAVTWSLAVLLGVLLAYCFIGFPESLARISLLGRSHEKRCDLALGLITIVLCLDRLARLTPTPSLRERRAYILCAALIAAAFLWWARLAYAEVGDLIGGWSIALATAGVGVLSFAHLAGWRRLFMGSTGALVVVTGIGFNPLVHGIEALDKLELSGEVKRLNQECSEPPLWVCFGGRYSGTLVSALGGRSATGIAFHPIDWHTMDPGGEFDSCANRYAHITFVERESGQPAWFTNPRQTALQVHIPWDHPALLEQGVRFVLREDDHASPDPRLRLRYRSSRQPLAIYEVVE